MYNLSLTLALPRPSMMEIENAQATLLYASANDKLFVVQYADPVGKYVFHESTHGYASTWRVMSLDLLDIQAAKQKLRASERAGRVVRVSSYLTRDGFPAVHSVVMVQGGA